MRRLVVLDLPGGPTFIDMVRRCLDAGEAFSPLDQRINGPARQRVLAALAPTDLIDQRGERHVLSGGRMVEDGDLVVVATSGTTGQPKGVILTDEAIAASARATSTGLGVDPANDHWLCSLPLNHVGGLSVVLRSLLTETKLTLLDHFDVELFDQALHEGATLTSLVPTTLKRLGDKRSAQFRKILLGGSAMPADLPDNVVTTYGMTETGSGVVYDRTPLGGVEIKITESGEIALRCPMLLRTYRNGIDPKDSDGYFRTGDVGSINEHGELQVLGRKSELIISGGENVWPVAIEQLLTGLPGIDEIAVAGVDDAEWGQRVVAIVVTNDKTTIDLAVLNDRCRNEIGPWAMMSELFYVNELPRTTIGKLDRVGIAKIINEKTARRD